MALYQIDLTIPDWEGEGPVEALRDFLQSAPTPEWEALEWDVTDLETGELFHVTLDDGVSPPQVSLEGPNGGRIPLDYVGDH